MNAIKDAIKSGKTVVGATVTPNVDVSMLADNILSPAPLRFCIALHPALLRVSISSVPANTGGG